MSFMHIFISCQMFHFVNLMLIIHYTIQYIDSSLPSVSMRPLSFTNLPHIATVSLLHLQIMTFLCQLFIIFLFVVQKFLVGFHVLNMAVNSLAFVCPLFQLHTVHVIRESYGQVLH